MAVSYAIDTRKQLIFSRATGVLTNAELAAHTQALLKDARFDPRFHQIYDFLGVTDLRISAALIRGQASTSPYSSGARRAYLVGSDAAFGLARMYQLSLGADSEWLGVFRTMAEGLEWLTLAPDTAWPEPDWRYADTPY